MERIAAVESEAASLRDQVSELILDCATDYAIITLDPDGTITRWNAGVSRITGYVAAEVLGRSGDIIFTSEDRAGGRFALELCRAIESGRAVNERWHLRRDGSRFWASGLMMPLLDAQGQPNGFLNILMDRTDARADTERRELLMAEMNHRIKNTFASVMAVAAQTGRHSATIEDFKTALASRLRVLSRSHDMLIRGDWVDAPLRSVIEGALEAYGGDPDRGGAGRGCRDACGSDGGRDEPGVPRTRDQCGQKRFAVGADRPGGRCLNGDPGPPRRAVRGDRLARTGRSTRAAADEPGLRLATAGPRHPDRWDSSFGLPARRPGMPHRPAPGQQRQAMSVADTRHLTEP